MTTCQHDDMQARQQGTAMKLPFRPMTPARLTIAYRRLTGRDIPETITHAKAQHDLCRQFTAPVVWLASLRPTLATIRTMARA